MNTTACRSLVLALLAVPATAATSGCSQVLYPHRPIHRPYGMARPLAAPVQPEWAARGRWDAVMRLPRGSVVDVLSMDGAAYIGAIGVVDASSLRVTVQGVEEHVARGDVLRVDLVDLPGSEVRAVARQAGIGAALGVGAAAIVAAVIGGSAWPPPGALLRGGAAIGGVAGGQSALSARQPRLILSRRVSACARAGTRLRLPARSPADGAGRPIAFGHGLGGRRRSRSRHPGADRPDQRRTVSGPARRRGRDVAPARRRRRRAARSPDVHRARRSSRRRRHGGIARFCSTRCRHGLLTAVRRRVHQ